VVRQRLTAGAGAVALVAAVFALNFYRLPVVALVPGPAEDVLSRIRVEGGAKVYDSKGKLYLTSVGIDDDVRFYEGLLDLANHDVQLRPRQELFPQGETPEQVDQQNVDDMRESKTTAIVVALRRLGYRIEPSGVDVNEVLNGSPADGRLRPGDRIRRVDGRRVASVKDVQAAIGRHHVGDRVVFQVQRDKRAAAVRVRVGADQGKPRVGVALSDVFANLPVRISIETENIGGPSAGLMFTLSIIDRLTPEDLTGGRRIAGTGQITLDGEVLPIGGIAEKLIAARRQGATVFLVPKGNCDEVHGHAPPGLRLVRVADVGDALRFLRQPATTASAPGC
jgi:PDZ domain-containing protein